MKKPTPEQLADKWIQELKEFGFTYEQMQGVFAKAREMFEDFKNKAQETCFVICESCGTPTDIEKTFTDAGDNYFCAGCWKELKPVLDKEYKELVANGEIEE